jgi:hypothetical protein
MTTPQIIDSPTYASGAAATQFTLTWGASIQRGDLLLMCVSSGQEGNSPATDPGDGDLRGYTHTHNDRTDSATTGCNSGCFYRFANGDEDNTSVSNVLPVADPGRTVRGFQIRGADPYSAPDVARAFSATAAANIDPPSNTAGWGAADNLVIAHLCVAGSTAISAGPSGYSNFATLSGVAATGACRTASATFNTSSDTENPGAFTSPSADYVVSTIMVRPMASAPAPTMRRWDVFETDATFPNDVTVTVQGGHGTELIVGVSGGQTGAALVLDPSGLNLSLTALGSAINTGAADMRWYRVPNPGTVPAGTYTLRGSRSSGTTPWGIWWFEFGNCSGVVDDENVTGSASAGTLTGAITGAANGICLFLTHISGSFSSNWLGNVLNGIPPAGYGECDGAADNQHANVYIGRTIAGSNSFTLVDGSASTAYVTAISLGYAPNNVNAPLHGAL